MPNSNLEKFMAEYARQLESAVTNHPEEYCYPTSEIPGVIKKMRTAFIEQSYNKDGRAIRSTCKALSIPYTYVAINKYLS